MRREMGNEDEEKSNRGIRDKRGKRERIREERHD